VWYVQLLLKFIHVIYIIYKSVNCNLELFSPKAWSINPIAILIHSSPSPYVTEWCKMIDYLLFTSCSRIFHLYGEVTITGEGLQNLDLCSALRAFEQGGIFIVPHLLWHWASVFPVSSEGLPQSVAFYNTQGDVEDLFYAGSSRVTIVSKIESNWKGTVKLHP
jgi:hypothetical protein